MADTRISLSSLARDPVVAAFLRRGELDNGNAFAVPALKQPVLSGGQAKALAREFALVD